MVKRKMRSSENNYLIRRPMIFMIETLIRNYATCIGIHFLRAHFIVFHFFFHLDSGFNLNNCLNKLSPVNIALIPLPS